MTAPLLVLIAAAVFVLALLMLVLRLLPWLALPALILSLLVVIAEGPRAATEIWGERVEGVVAATEASVKVETANPGGSRTSHTGVRHRFGALVCYRAPGPPGLGAATPTDPAILAAVGETLSDADRHCHAAPGDGILRQSRVRLDEASFDAEVPGRPVMLRTFRPFGLLEWTWPIDAPLLPMLPRPTLGGKGTRVAVQAEVTDIRIDARGRGLLSRRAQDYAVPVAYVSLRYAPPGHPDGVEGVDKVDAPSVSGWAPGTPVVVTVSADSPRAPHLVGVERSHPWRNVRTDVLTLAGIIAVVLLVIGLRKRAARQGA